MAQPEVLARPSVLVAVNDAVRDEEILLHPETVGICCWDLRKPADSEIAERGRSFLGECSHSFSMGGERAEFALHGCFFAQRGLQRR